MNDSFVSLATKLPPLESTAESGVSESMEQDVENSFGNTCNEVDSASFVDDTPQSTSSIAAYL